MGHEPLPGESPPVALGESLGRLRRYLGTARPDSLATLVAHWPRLVGGRLADHCELYALRRGTLVVATPDPTVAEHLRWAATDLAGAANSLLGRDEVERVEVRVVDGL